MTVPPTLNPGSDPADHALGSSKHRLLKCAADRLDDDRPTREQVDPHAAALVDAAARTIHILQADPHASYPGCEAPKRALQTPFNELRNMGLMTSGQKLHLYQHDSSP